MAILLTRNSDTPTISNNDYARMIRLACGGYNGITKGYGNECQVSSSANNIKIANGEIVWQGWQTLIPASGETISIDVINEKRYYSLYLKIDLSLSEQTSTFNVVYGTVDYPSVELGDDLTINSNGITKVLFAQFTATNGIIANIVRKIQIMAQWDCANAENASNYIADGTISIELNKKAEFYKGNNNGELDYPVGSIILAKDDMRVSKLNSRVFVRIVNLNLSTPYYSAVSSTSLDYPFLYGDWRFRGRSEFEDTAGGTTYRYLLAQRIS